MRIILLSLFITLPALACPDLQGFYKKCTSATGAISPVNDLTITQKENVYTFSSQDFIADGVTRVKENGDMKISETYTCEGEVFSGVSEIFMNGGYLGTFRMDVTKAGNILTTELTGTLLGNNVYDTQTCE